MTEQVISIRTQECDICRRFDTVMLSSEEVRVRAKTTDMGIGAYSIKHTDHTRIVYFDEDGSYLGDTIALSSDDMPEMIQTQSIPFYIINKKKVSLFHKLRDLVSNWIYSKNLNITVTGPSRAGKTSLVRYLDTLVPERDGQLVNSVPTMGKSKKRIQIGNTNITTMDMGGQEDFWDLWEEPIEESDLIIFILDGTSNNLLEVAKAFERVITYRKENTPVLILINKKDIALRGESKIFSTTGEFLALTSLTPPLDAVLSIETSIFEGTAYMIDQEELPLAEVISSFISDHV